MIEWENHQWREAKQILGVTVQDGYNISLNGVIGNKNKVYKNRGGGVTNGVFIAETLPNSCL